MEAAPSVGPVRARRAWPLERVLFLTAGTMTLLSALLAALVSPWFLLLSAFVSFGNCPSSWLLQRYAGLQRGMPR
ncbi:MAG: DUF2892 domain-containing protein [Thermoleophilia bacterium]